MHTCVIFCAAGFDFPAEAIKTEDFVIAADGGLKHTERLGLTPDVILGDFDSLGYVPEAEEIIQHPVRKDDPDTLLAIRLGLERGFRNFVITGALGGRLDHSFANLQTLLFLRDHGARGVLYGDGFAATAVTDSSITLEGSGTLSVFTMDSKAEGVTLRNVSFPVEDATLTNSFPIGVSNAFIGEPAALSVAHGTLLVMWQAEKEELPKIVEMV